MKVTDLVESHMKLIITLKKLRKKTSYDYTVDFNEEDAKKRVIQAEKFIKMLKNSLLATGIITKIFLNLFLKNRKIEGKIVPTEIKILVPKTKNRREIHPN